MATNTIKARRMTNPTATFMEMKVASDVIRVVITARTKSVNITQIFNTIDTPIPIYTLHPNL